MGKLAQAVFNALSPDDSFHSAERNTSRTVQECRYYHVNSVRPQSVVVLFSLGKKSQHKELH